MLRVINKISALEFVAFAYNFFKTMPLVVMTSADMIVAVTINSTTTGTDLLK